MKTELKNSIISIKKLRGKTYIQEERTKQKIDYQYTKIE